MKKENRQISKRLLARQKEIQTRIEERRSREKQGVWTIGTDEAQSLELIEITLDKLQRNAFGKCEGCSQAIEQRRLEATLFVARQCRECQEGMEAEQVRVSWGVGYALHLGFYHTASAA